MNHVIISLIILSLTSTIPLLIALRIYKKSNKCEDILVNDDRYSYERF